MVIESNVRTKVTNFLNEKPVMYLLKNFFSDHDIRRLRATLSIDAKRSSLCWKVCCFTRIIRNVILKFITGSLQILFILNFTNYENKIIEVFLSNI